jgi:hypothetical protein
VQVAASPDASPEIRTMTLASGNFFAVMWRAAGAPGARSCRRRMVLGRDAVAVLSYRFWQQALGADPAVLGRRCW